MRRAEAGLSAEELWKGGLLAEAAGQTLAVGADRWFGVSERGAGGIRRAAWEEQTKTNMLLLLSFRLIFRFQCLSAQSKFPSRYFILHQCCHLQIHVNDVHDVKFKHVTSSPAAGLQR